MAIKDKLTDTAIKAARARTKPCKLFDGGGLYLLVRPDGKRYWRLKYYVAGKEKLISLGVYPRVTLKTARRRATEAHAQIDDGQDPSVHRQEAKAARRSAAGTTFEAVSREWYAKRSKSWAASNAIKVLGRLENDVFPWLGAKPIAELTGPKILETLRRVEERVAVESAHRIRQTINSIFIYAIDTHRVIGNPTPRSDALETPKKGSYASITDPQGVGKLMRAIRGYSGGLNTRVALQLAPLVFVRPGELRAAEWSEFDLERGEWRIPGARMKAKAPHLVPLAKQATALLTELQPLTGSGRFVFPSERGPTRPMSSNTLNAALRTLGFAKEQMTAHGFRHMASTLLNERGWNRDAIERQLAHSERDSIRAAYNAAEYLPERRKMMHSWADYLDELAAGDGAKVVNIKAARK
jgi:integrase